MMRRININPRYIGPIRERAVTGVLVKQLQEDVKIGDVLSFSVDGFQVDNLEAFVTGIDRLRLDELETRHVVACGYSHKDLLIDNLILDLGINDEDGDLFYFIEFKETDVFLNKTLDECVSDTDSTENFSDYMILSSTSFCDYCLRKECEKKQF